MNNLLRSILLLCCLICSAQARTLATFHTPAGDMVVELYDDQKPATVQNFIRLVQNNAYRNTFFHRCMPNFIVQGGGFSTSSQTTSGAFNQAYSVPNFGKVTNEFLVGQKFSNTYGTIAMAKVDGDPNSATSQWFFNLANNSANLDAQNGGFTVFGKVISGNDVLERFRTSSKGGGIVDMRTWYGASYGVFSDLPVNYNGFTLPFYYDLMYTDISLTNYVPHYTLAVTTNGSGSVTRSVDQPAYISGSTFQLTATPSNGYAFTAWSGAYSGTQNPLTVTMTANLNITAKFDKTWSLTVTNTTGGYVLKVPDQTAYLNQSTVTLQPTPYAGFRFAGWSGDASGTLNPLTITMNANKTITAAFIDIAPPEILLQSPVGGDVTSEVVTLSGIVTDNVKLESVHWELDGQPKGTITVNTNNNSFSVTGILLHKGANVLRVVASDSFGNQGSASVIVNWAPVRTIFVAPVADQQEGSLVTVPLQMTSKGDVGGMVMSLTFDTNYLADAKLVWGSIAANSQTGVQTSIPGKITANFQQPGASIPAGTMTFASAKFRLRSTAGTVTTPLTLTVSTVKTATGQPLTFGTDVQSGSVGITKRTLTGDGDANNKLDIGDAVLIQKLVAGVTPQRPWDVTGNDLNKNGRLDSDDVNRVLRVVVGLDPQPAGASGLVSEDPGVTTQPQIQDVAAAVNSVVLPLSDQAIVAPKLGQMVEGGNIVVQIVLTNLATHISGAALALNYPTGAFTLVDYQVAAPFVPSSAAILWNAAQTGANAGTLSVGASSTAAWQGTNGLAAMVTLKAIVGSATATPWHVTVDEAQVTPDGYDLRSLAGGSAFIQVGLASGPQLGSISAPSGGAPFGFVITGQPGQTWEVEASENLVDWTTLMRTNNTTGSVKFTDGNTAQHSKRYYRVVVP